MLEITTTYDFSAVADSRIGGRKENQDTFGYDDTPLGLLLVVCDGMGGGPCGKTASMLAAKTFIESVRGCSPNVPRINAIERAVKEVARILSDAESAHVEYHGMGTTLAAVLISPYSAVVAHIGDSRVYQLRGRRRIFKTADHSQIYEIIKPKTYQEEEEARLAPNSNVITRALGPVPDVKAEIKELPYEKGDRFVLCSDGIWGMLSGKEFQKIAGTTRSLAGALESLVLTVEERGAEEGNHHDNLTVAIVETHHNSKLKQPMSTKVRNILIAISAICLLSLIGNFLQYKATHMPSAKAENGAAHIIDDNEIKKQFDELRKQNEELNQKLDQQRKENIEREKQYGEKLHKLQDQLKENGGEKINQEVLANVGTEAQLSDLISKINELIEHLNALKTMSGRTSREEITKSVTQCRTEFKGVEDVVKSLGIKDADFENCVQKDFISHRIMSETKRSDRIGHINAIIGSLDSLKSTIITKK